MAKDKSKKKSKADKAPKKGKSKEIIEDAVIVEDFPVEAPAKSDEAASMHELSKKDKKRVEALEVGNGHISLPHLEHLHRVGYLAKIIGDSDAKKKLRKAAEVEMAMYRAEGEKRMMANNRAEKAEKKAAADVKAAPAVAFEPVEIVVDEAAQAELDEVKERVLAKRAIRAAKGEHAVVTEEEIELQRAHARNEDAKTIKGSKKDKAKSAAAEILAVDSPDLPTPPITDEEVAADLEPAVAEAEALAAQIAADKDSLDPHNIDDVTVKNGRPYLKVIDPTTGEVTEKAYSRVTNWIDVLDDKSALTDWKLRTELAGLVAIDELDPDADPILGEVRAADVKATKAIAKLDKASRKGELLPGEYAEKEAEIEKAYKDALNELSERALDLGGAFDKARRGTHLHAYFELFDTAHKEAKGKLTVDEWIESDENVVAVNGREVIPADVADLKAYREAIDALGIEFVDIERRVVNEEHGTTGTLDRGGYFKPEGATRRSKVVMDLKTGRIDYGAGKIAQQISEYSSGEYYDPATGAREKTGYSKSVGLLIHSPAGEARTTIYEIDLSVGVKRNKLAVEVKAARAEATEARAYRGATPFYKVLIDPSNSALSMTEGQRKKAKAAK